MKKLLLIATAMLWMNSLILGQTCPTGSFPPGCVDSNGIHGQILDTGGQVFNVKAYGATGNGTTDDTAAVNAAISAAQVNGGVLYFPPGVYELKNPNQVNPSNKLSGHTFVSIQCASPTSTTIQFTGSSGFLLSNLLRVAGYYGGDVKGCLFDLSKASSGTVALRAVDSVGWMIHNNSFTGTPGNSDVGIEFENSAAWSERNQVNGSQFSELKSGVKFLQDSGDTYTSFDYSVLRDNHFEIPASGDAILYTGPMSQTNGDIVTGMANFDTTGNFVHASSGATISGITIRIATESGGGSPYGNILCGDTGTTWTGVSGWFVGFSGEAMECSGGVSIPYAGVDEAGRANSAGALFLGSTAGVGIGGPSPKISWTYGSSAPSGSCSNGSLYSDTAGSSGSTLYACVSGSWVDVK